MRMFLLPFLVFLPLYAHAATDCGIYQNTEQTEEQQKTSCKNAPGCYWDLSGCTECPETNDNGRGYYCPGVDDPNKCNEWESELGLCNCPQEFPRATAGTTDINNCYAPCATTSDDYETVTKNCGLTYLGYSYANEVSCKNNNGTITYDSHETNYHAEPLSDNTYGCYFKYRPCSSFHTETCTGNVVNTATWTTNWNVQSCECKQEEFSDTANFCNGKRNKKPSQSTISNVNEPINYDYDTQSSWHWCVSCFYGYYVESDDILGVGENNQTCIVGEDNNGGLYAVCKCTPAPQGTWIDSCNITYPITNPNNPICSLTNCPAGKTTTGTGSTNSNACHYGDQTQICDSAGCVNLSNLDTPENWTDLP